MKTYSFLYIITRKCRKHILLEVGKEFGLEASAHEIKYIVTLTPIARQRVGKQVPAKTDP
jgi:hypothetical protein